MIGQIITPVVMIAITMVGLGIIPVPHIPVDLIVGRVYWLPIVFYHKLPNLVSSIGSMIPAFLVLPIILMFAAGLLALKEMD